MMGYTKKVLLFECQVLDREHTLSKGFMNSKIECLCGFTSNYLRELALE